MERRRILWVDDDADMLRGLVYPLEKSGYIVSVAYDEKEAFDMINHSDFDLIIIDLILPSGRTGVSDIGYLVGQRLARCLLLEKKIHTPIIILSVVNDPHINEDLISMGVKAIFSKGRMLPSEFKNRIERILENN